MAALIRPAPSWSRALAWLAAGLGEAGPDKPAGVEAVLAEFGTRLDEFRRELSRLSEQAFTALLPLSRETPTHYKWHMFAIEGADVNVWIHEYKPKASRSQGYAQSIHNHRYPMSVLLLTGGYCCGSFTVQAARDGVHADVRSIGTERLRGGSIYSMSPDEFHSVTEIQDGTVSLMVQGKPVRSSSVSVDVGSRLLVAHTPIEGRHANLRSALGPAEQGWAAED
jgi:hypothetical protein